MIALALLSTIFNEDVKDKPQNIKIDFAKHNCNDIMLNIILSF